MNTTKADKYQAVIFINEPGKWLLGGVKIHRSIAFHSRADAQSWLIQAVETNQNRPGFADVKIHGRIKETH